MNKRALSKTGFAIAPLVLGGNVIARASVTAPISSVTTAQQVEGLAHAVALKLTSEEIDALNAASA
jgi:aryl-alcohol dehydrogenase-like predicted oxidoreductase